MPTTPDPHDGSEGADLGTESHDAPPPRRGTRRRKKGAGRSIVQVLGIMTLALAMITSLGAMYLYRKLNNNITHTEALGFGNNRPSNEPVEGDPLDILIMGSDFRVDGSVAGERSDTTILLHLSADRKRAYGISIPRDSVVNRPDCTLGDGRVVPGSQEDLWNAAYALGNEADDVDGGPACTIQQFESLTKIKIEHLVVVNFPGFKGMVDAVGGVRMCVPEPIVDDEALMWTLPAGKNVLLKGDDALNYVRVRHGAGDGSDISRTRRQQAFIAAMIKKVMSAGTLSSPTKVYSFLDAATSSLTSDMNVKDMASLALEFKDIGLDDIQFLTIPNYYPPLGTRWDNNVMWDQPAADEVWKAIRKDQPIPAKFMAITTTARKGGKVTKATKGSKSATSGASAGASATPTETPAGTPSDSPDEESYEDRYADPEFNGLCS